TVEDAEHAASDRTRPLRDNLGDGLSRRNPWPVGARGSEGVPMRANDARNAGVARPPHGDSALRPAKPRRNATLAPAEDERERTGPMVGDEARGVGGQL